MRRAFLPMLVSLSLILAAPSAFADRRDDIRRERNNNRSKRDKRNNGNHRPGKNDRAGHDKNRGHKDHDKHRGHKDHNMHRPGRPATPAIHNHRGPVRHDFGRHMPPPPPPAHRFHHHHRPTPPPPPPPRFYNMVGRICPGARYVRVWEMNPGVYMLRYLLGGIWYMQEVYPTRNAYGRRMRVYEADNYWYSDNGYRYYDYDDGLGVDYDGRVLYDGILKPRININISL